jgi:hypothetical protein
MAARALLHGWDPIAFGNLAGVDQIWAMEVLAEAEDVWLERRKDIIKAVEVAVQRGVVAAFK